MKKNIAIVGYGGQGGWHGIMALRNDVVNIAGVYDIRPERIDLAHKRNINTYNSFEEVLADKDVDIVVCATPNDIHEEICIRALEAGKHVICEKPVTLSVESFDRIVEAANKNNRVFSVHQNRRWDTDFVLIKNLIESKEIDDVIRIESRVHGSRGVPGGWRSKKENGGGLVLDWGVHLIDQMLQVITDEIDTISCRCTYLTSTEVDDGFRLTINFKSGKQGYVEVASYNFIKLPRFYMLCKKGTALIPDFRENAQITKCKAWNEREVVPVQTAAGITMTMSPRDELTIERYIKELPQTDVHDFYRNFCDTIDGKAEQIVKNEEARRVLKVMMAAFESDRNGGTPIPFDELA